MKQTHHTIKQRNDKGEFAAAKATINHWTSRGIKLFPFWILWEIGLVLWTEDSAVMSTASGVPDLCDSLHNKVWLKIIQLCACLQCKNQFEHTCLSSKNIINTYEQKLLYIKSLFNPQEFLYNILYGAIIQIIIYCCIQYWVQKKRGWHDFKLEYFSQYRLVISLREISILVVDSSNYLVGIK